VKWNFSTIYASITIWKFSSILSVMRIKTLSLLFSIIAFKKHFCNFHFYGIDLFHERSRVETYIVSRSFSVELNFKCSYDYATSNSRNVAAAFAVRCGRKKSFHAPLLVSLSLCTRKFIITKTSLEIMISWYNTHIIIELNIFLFLLFHAQKSSSCSKASSKNNLHECFIKKTFLLALERMFN
jgi:hypothetical protein